MDRTVRQVRGARNYHAGRAAEESVARHYQRSGCAIGARRWRGAGGEIDIIARNGAEVIFIEVKQSRTHAEAALHVTRRQLERIQASAAEFLGGEPAGQLTPVRIEVALVDSRGEIEIIENAWAA